MPKKMTKKAEVKEAEKKLTEDSGKNLQETAEEKEKVIATVTDGNLRVRRDPSTDNDPVDILKDGAEVEVVSIGDDWCEIKGGYVMRQFLIF